MKKILIIEARFYGEIANDLFDAAKAVLDKSDISYEKIQVPGVFEIPACLAMAVKSKKYDGFITLGCVIRGETTHYDYVCGESARGINNIAIKKRIALGYGIITVENQEQADVRADKNQKDVGGKAARACLEMIRIRGELNS